MELERVTRHGKASFDGKINGSEATVGGVKKLHRHYDFLEALGTFMCCLLSRNLQPINFSKCACVTLPVARLSCLLHGA